MTIVAILHPGQMGASVAAAAVAGGHDVVWAGADRSAATRARAEQLGLRDVGSVADVAACADVVVSVCPPAAALGLAEQVAAHRFAGTYLDANAVSPATAAEVAAAVAGGGALPVDGGIVGPPAWRAGTTRLYVSGDGAAELVGVLGRGDLEVIDLAAPIGAASALKMAYAGWTKGSSALLLAMVAYAEAAGVRDALVGEWGRSQPGVAERAEGVAAGTGPKAWRFEGEMREIAASLVSVGLPGGFHEAAADAYARLAPFKDADGPTLDEVVASLIATRSSG